MWCCNIEQVSIERLELQSICVVLLRYFIVLMAMDSKKDSYYCLSSIFTKRFKWLLAEWIYNATTTIHCKINVGMIPLGRKASPDKKAHIDPEPFPPPKLDPVHPRKVEPEIEAGRLSPLLDRKCNIIDIGFRNEAGFPLSVFWAGTTVDVPDNGFTCGEKYKFHMGLNAAPQSRCCFSLLFWTCTQICICSRENNPMLCLFSLTHTILLCPHRNTFLLLAYILSSSL